MSRIWYSNCWISLVLMTAATSKKKKTSWTPNDDWEATHLQVTTSRDLRWFEPRFSLSVASSRCRQLEITPLYQRWWISLDLGINLVQPQRWKSTRHSTFPFSRQVHKETREINSQTTPPPAPEPKEETRNEWVWRSSGAARSLVWSKVAAAATRMTRTITKESQSSSCMFNTKPGAKSERNKEQKLNLPLCLRSSCSLSTHNPTA